MLNALVFTGINALFFGAFYHIITHHLYWGGGRNRHSYYEKKNIWPSDSIYTDCIWFATPWFSFQPSFSSACDAFPGYSGGVWIDLYFHKMANNKTNQNLKCWW